jgi:hypothetical protein
VALQLFNLKGWYQMKEFWNVIQLIFTAVGGWLGWFLGGCDGLLYALLAFVTIDYITGVMCAFADIQGLCLRWTDRSRQRSP